MILNIPGGGDGGVLVMTGGGDGGVLVMTVVVMVVWW